MIAELAMLCVAHAGGNEHAIENTRAAFQSSRPCAVETDVRFTKDNVPVIMHDDTVDRTTDGTGPVSSFTLAQLRTLRTIDGQYVPTLYEFLADTGDRTGNRQVFVELKVKPTLPQWAAFNDRFAWLHARGRTVVLTGDKALLPHIRANSYIPGWIDELGDRDPADIPTTYYFKHHWSVTADRAAKWHKAGIKVFAWTPDRQDVWQRFKQYGTVSGVVTNKPTAFTNWSKT